MMTATRTTGEPCSMSVNEIRPDTLQAGMIKAIRVDVERLKSRKREFVLVSCPACGSKRNTLKFSKYGMKFVECLRCATIFTNPRPTAEVLAWFYRDSANYDYWNKHVFPAADTARRLKMVVPRVDMVLGLCTKYGVNTEAILEVGAAHGSFCHEMLSRNVFKKVVAVEPVVSLADTCRSKSIVTINQPIETVKFKKSPLFDVVVSFEVIEHLFSPRTFVLGCKKALKPGGLFVFTVPNGQGFDVSTLGALSDTVDHEHLNYFNPESIQILLKKCALEVVDVATPGRLDAELVRRKIVSGEFKASNQPFIRRLLVDEWERTGVDFQRFIAEHRLSSHMMVISRTQ
jgi:2-polyprenyl-3-methyl-5-hydroxy-6-metoxy-1,4-benzoquinol methylase